jgi:4-amino-4-deoxy-L-arabinose transferase-like glycosyltransferase
MTAPRGWLVAMGVAATLGVVIRVSNAFLYPIDMGYDAGGNWDYIALLLDSWALPAPDEGWATAHPPFFYYLAAVISRAVGSLDKTTAIHAIRLVTAASGLLGIGLAVVLVRRADPDNMRRAFIAGALLLFLPVHIYMSAMLGEEILVTALISIVVVGVGTDLLSPPASGRALMRAALFGAVAGLALLTKLTGLLVVGAGSAAYLIEAIRSQEKLQSFQRAAVFAASALLVGGWFYVWNLVTYGYIYPHGLDVHSVMFSMPPGTRTVSDYLWIPWQTFSDPHLLSPSLLHSVWGSTYVTIWFDGHLHFLPASGSVVAKIGTAILLLGVVPTAAFAMGLWRGGRRVFQATRGPDVVLILLVVATLGGYVLFTWRNPWFAVLKGSFLLGLSVPFSYYASEVLADWTRGRVLRSVAVFGCLGLLAVLVMVTFSYGFAFEKHELPGVRWTPVEAPWQG